jgi:hypothetical protein
MDNKNRISRFADVPNEFPKLADAMVYKLTKHGISTEDAKKRVMQALIEAFNYMVAGDQEAVNEFAVVIAHNTHKDPKIKLTHTSGLKSDTATDHAKAYGIISAFAQYWGTHLIGDHVNKDDHYRAFSDFYRNIEVHVQQLREHERQEKLGGATETDP